MDLRPDTIAFILIAYLCNSFAQNNGLFEANKGDSLAKRKHILVLENENLLINSVVSILSARNEYEVSSIKLNSAHKVDQLNGNGPEVFILDEADLAANINVLVELVDHYPRMRLIVLGLEDNLLHIFNQQIVQVEQVSDFLEQL